MKDSYSDLVKPVDEWLWIPWKKFLKKRQDRIYHIRHPEQSKKSSKNTRKRKKGKLISIIYSHEVHHPTIPIGQYK